MCCGNRQLLVSSSSNQNIQLKNLALTKIETLNPKSKDKNNINQWRLKFTSTKCCNVIKDCWEVYKINAMNAINKQVPSSKTNQEQDPKEIIIH
jgi:hypothetical protein